MNTPDTANGWTCVHYATAGGRLHALRAVVARGYAREIRLYATRGGLMLGRLVLTLAKNGTSFS